MEFESWRKSDILRAISSHRQVEWGKERDRRVWYAALDAAVEVADRMVCDADGFHVCHHNEYIAVAIKELKE